MYGNYGDKKELPLQVSLFPKIHHLIHNPENGCRHHYQNISILNIFQRTTFP